MKVKALFFVLVNFCLVGGVYAMDQIKYEVNITKLAEKLEQDNKFEKALALQKAEALANLKNEYDKVHYQCIQTKDRHAPELVRLLISDAAEDYWKSYIQILCMHTVSANSDNELEFNQQQFDRNWQKIRREYGDILIERNYTRLSNYFTHKNPFRLRTKDCREQVIYNLGNELTSLRDQRLFNSRQSTEIQIQLGEERAAALAEGDVQHPSGVNQPVGFFGSIKNFFWGTRLKRATTLALVTGAACAGYFFWKRAVQ